MNPRYGCEHLARLSLQGLDSAGTIECLPNYGLPKQDKSKAVLATLHPFRSGKVMHACGKSIDPEHHHQLQMACVAYEVADDLVLPGKQMGHPSTAARKASDVDELALDLDRHTSDAKLRRTRCQRKSHRPV
jgi:hypothetical protein